MPRIHIPALNKTLDCPAGARLIDVLADAGIFMESPCGGRGVCGKCRVRVVADAGMEYRPACTLRPDRDLIVEIPPAETKHRFLTTGVVPDFIFEPAIRETGEAYGLAVDIGTTTVVVALVDLRDGSERGTRSALNPQKRQGPDVLSRIAYARRYGPEGLRLLQREIADALGEMGLSLCAERGIGPHAVREIAVAANTTMLHLLLGVDPSPMGVAPFTPAFTESRTIRASDIGLPFEKSDLFTLPSVSAFVGADVVAGIWASGAFDSKEDLLFVDIGTNGEIVLARNGRLTACSCAAGPALEGMNIRCGMRAAEGAIEDVVLSPDGSARLSVIGDVPPTGICGSGILSALRELLRVGLVQSDGYMLGESDLMPDSPWRSLCLMEDGQTAVSLAPSVVVTQKDVRQVQLAKGAILSGIRVLLDRAGTGIPNRVFVAGQFGAHLPVASLTGCGLLPELPKESVAYVGNTSLSGARAALLSLPARREMDALAKSIEYVELAGSEGYEQIFLQSLEFPKPGR